jgi:hypothetical protein
VDALAYAREERDRIKKELAVAEKKYQTALAPILAAVEAQAQPKQGVQLTGAAWSVELGKAREERKLIDPVQALVRLESVERGLGYRSISIPIKVLDNYLRPEEREDLFTITYGARSVKATKLS